MHIGLRHIYFNHAHNWHVFCDIYIVAMDLWPEMTDRLIRYDDEDLACA